MTRQIILVLLALGGCATVPAATQHRPNIVIILADDLGYGDVRCLNPAGKILTPNLDRLAASGMIFTDAHSSSAVCTPTRYGLLTGRYNWRSRLKSHVQGGMSPPLIEPGRLTLPAFLQRQSYHTACVGKWHLGMDWTRKPNAPAFDDTIEKGPDGWRVDFSKPIARGPNSVGFDYYFGIAASLDMVPYTFIENTRVTEIPTQDNAFPLMLGRTNRMTRRGPAAAGFEAENVLPTLTRKAVEYIEQRAADARSGRPFFLYLPLASPHTPIAPTTEWRGRSGINPYADFVMQTDAEVGTILDTLQRLGLSTNTLVIFTSDNGCSPEAKFDELAAAGHRPSAQFRGTKADIFEGGHRVPFLAAWPRRIKAGTTSDQLICLNDLFATCAEILGQKLPDHAAEDSVSILPALEGRATKPLREALVHHSINGSFAIRQGKWKLNLCADSGGWSAPRPGNAAGAGLPAVQLYDLAQDIGETNNVQAAHPKVVARLTGLLEKYVADGRSTPGRRQTNTTPVKLQSLAKTPARSDRPNILFIVGDDMGYADVGFHGCKEIPTPNLDGLAASGVRFTSGYVSGPYCSPTRAGLLTGRYQNRFGHEFNPGGAQQGMPTNQITVADRLKAAGYRTALIGKWHLGGGDGMRPLQRGFDEFFGFLGGAHSYFNAAGFLRGDEPVKEMDYSTDAFGREAVSFIDRYQDRPWFLYLSFNAVHTPMDATSNRLAKFSTITDPKRRAHDAMLLAMDEAIGLVLKKLSDTGQREKTLVCFISDNGGPTMPGTTVNASRNDPFRGSKRTTLEGGIRVPFVISWPGRLKPGVSAQPVIQLDLTATTLAAAGVKVESGSTLDGVDLLPFLSGAKTGAPHDALYWRFGQQMAIRDGDWKLVRYDLNADTLSGKRNQGVTPARLYNLASDISETNDLAAAMPKKAKELQTKWDRWNRSNVPPLWGGGEAVAQPK